MIFATSLQFTILELSLTNYFITGLFSFLQAESPSVQLFISHNCFVKSSFSFTVLLKVLEVVFSPVHLVKFFFSLTVPLIIVELDTAKTVVTVAGYKSEICDCLKKKDTGETLVTVTSGSQMFKFQFHVYLLFPMICFVIG